MATQAENRVFTDQPDIRHDWTKAEAEALLALPFNDLLYRAHGLHRRYFDANAVQLSTLLNVKDGGCPEDCKYCAQSARYETGFKAQKLMALGDVLDKARAAKAAGAQRFCMGAAWRSPKDHELEQICDMVGAVKELGLETCVTLGMLSGDQARRLKRAGLDYYNHNLDTSEEYYGAVITTRTYRDRLETLGHVRDAGINVCCGGILGLGEAEADRASMLVTLANLAEHPESVPINMLVAIEGTPYAENDQIDPIDFVRVIAAARIMMPASVVRFAAGRLTMDAATQALAFFAGANSIFYGEKLLTTPNPDGDSDQALFARLGLKPMEVRG
ncbi:MAG: biotin synthase BioB [Alphaproteobacteria bacterium]|nr:biotin synthase BioB [Alphaproteobacteria bacterium]